MNHQSFEEWLLSDDELTSEQEQALSHHLETCQQCPPIIDAWQNVMLDIKFTPEVSPPPGFTQRFEARLMERRAESQQKWTVISLLGFCLGAILLSLLGVILRYGGLPTPATLFANIAYSFIVNYQHTIALLDILQGVFGRIPIFIPILIWISTMVSLLLWAFIWFVSVWRLPYTQRSLDK